MTSGLLERVPRRVPPAEHRGPSSHPITRGLVNAAWGSPLRDLWGNEPLSAPSVRPAHDNRGGVIGNASRNTSPQYWRARFNVTTNTPCTMFAVVWIDSTLERGIVVGLGDSANADTGINIGVGNTAPDAVGNNLVGTRGGINFDASGQAIGTGWHTIAKTTDGSSNETWWIDGVRRSTTGTGATFNISSGTARFLMMQHGGNTGLGPTAGIHAYLGAVWNRVLSTDELVRLHDDPWLIVRRPTNIAVLAPAPTGDDVEGAANLELGGVTVTGAGVVGHPGSANLELGGVTVTGAGERGVEGAANLEPGGLTLTASGDRAVFGSAALALGGVTVTGAGERGVEGAANLEPGGLTLTASGVVSRTGAATLDLDGLALTVAGERGVLGSAALELDGVDLTATGTASGTGEGTANLVLGGLTLTASGVVGRYGSAELDLDGLALTVAGLVSRTGAAELELGGLTLAASGVVEVTGTVAMLLGGLTTLAVGRRGVVGQAALVLGGLTVTGTGAGDAPTIDRRYYVTVAARSSIAGELAATGRITATIPPPITAELNA